MVFFKRLSRTSRSNSYVDDAYDDAEAVHSSSSPTANAPRAFNRYETQRPDPQRQSLSQHNIHSNPNFAPLNISGANKDGQFVQSPPASAGGEMYRQGHADTYRPHTTENASLSRGLSGTYASNGMGMSHNAMPVDGPAMDGGPSKLEPAPDMLTRAFNAAVRPYSDKIAELEEELANTRSVVDSLESERRELFQWIDKRGLRPDVPPTIARAMDENTDPAQPTTAAATSLSAQLDRKITIVNFDLHRLQDDLNDSISTSHFAASMLKFLPEIARLSSLHTGPKHAFDLVLKLGGNLNSHGGLDSTSADDVDARKDFFGKLDDALVAVVERRFDEEGQDWGVQREIRRLEKTREYLRQFGVEPYFPQSLELMKSEAGPAGVGASAPGGFASDGAHAGTLQQLNGGSN